MINSNPTKTSRALRAVACGDKMEELIESANGTSLEHVLVAHLELFKKHVTGASHVDKYTLKEARSPACTRMTKMVPVVGNPGKKTSVPLTKEEIFEDLSVRFEKHTIIDIEYVCKKRLDKTTMSSSSGSPFVLITTNSVKQAQSADVIVFSSSYQGGSRNAVLNIVINLFQAKHYQNISGGTIDTEKSLNSCVLTKGNQEIRFDIRVKSDTGYLWVAKIVPDEVIEISATTLPMNKGDTPPSQDNEVKFQT